MNDCCCFRGRLRNRPPIRGSLLAFPFPLPCIGAQAIRHHCCSPGWLFWRQQACRRLDLSGRRTHDGPGQDRESGGRWLADIDAPCTNPAVAVCKRHTQRPRREVIHQLVQAFVPADMPCGRSRSLPPVPCTDAQFCSQFASHEPVVGIQHLCSADVARNGLADHRTPSLPFHLGIRLAGNCARQKNDSERQIRSEIARTCRNGKREPPKVVARVSHFLARPLSRAGRSSPSWFAQCIVDRCSRDR